MIMDVEELVRDAQLRQADRAVATERIRGGLRRLVARRRRRNRYLVAAGVSAALVLSGGAVAVGAQVAGDRHRGSVTAPGRDTDRLVTLGFSPGWVPGGWAETTRTLKVLGDDIMTVPAPGGGFVLRTGPLRRTTERIWINPNSSTYVSLLQSPTRPGGDVGAQPVDVGGRPGTVAEQSDGYLVRWSIDGRELLLFSADSRGTGAPPGRALSRDQVLRMAASVGADSTAFPAPLHLSWRPEGSRVDEFQVTGVDPASYRAFLFLSRVGTAGAVTVELGRGPLPAGAPLTVAGRAAVVPAQPERGPKADLAVDMGHGSVLTLTGDLRADQAELIRIAENARIADDQ